MNFYSSQGTSNFADEKEDFARVEKGLKLLIFAIATSLNAEESPELNKQIDELIEFENQLDEVNFLNETRRFNLSFINIV